MDGYKVNIVALTTTIQTLEDGANQIREANKDLAAAGQLNLLGNDTLKNEAHKFEDKWRYGLKKLDEAAEGVIERLRSAKDNYQALEEAHSELFNSIFPDAGGCFPGPGAASPPAGSPVAPPDIPGGGFTGGIAERLG